MAIADAKFIVGEASADLNNEILSQNIANLNIIRNGSFEDWSGDTPFQWSKIGTPTEVVRDTGDRDNFGAPYAAKITSAGSGNEGLQHTLSKLKPSTTYSVYARAKATSGDTAKIWTTGAGTNLSQTTTSTVWATLTGTFVTDSTPTDVVLKIGSDTDTDVIYFDSIMVVEGEAPFAFAPNTLDAVLQLFKNIPLVNLLRNGDFESWSMGENVPPDAWTGSGGQQYISRETNYGLRKIGASSAKIISDTNSDSYISQYFVNPENFTVTYTFRCWVRTGVANKVCLKISGETIVYSDYHPGDNTWKFLTVKHTIGAGVGVAFQLFVGQADSGTVTGYFDGAIAVKNMESAETGLMFAFAPHPLDVGGEVYKDLSLVKGVGITDRNKDTKIQLEESLEEDKIRFDTNGFERMIIDNNGKVGIGTSAPDEMLHINGGNIKLDGSHTLKGLAAPTADGDAIRQTTNITETNLDDAVTKKHTQNTDQYLDEGGANEVAVADVRSFIDSKGENSGLAELDAGGKVPSSQLPAYVDDVIEVANYAALPGTGETGKIYVTLDDNLTYRWSGSAYVEISASLALGDTSATAYRGDRGKTAYDHSQITSGNPHGTTKADVGLGNVTDNAQYYPGGTDVAVSDGGTGASSKPAAFDNLSPLTTQGDILYHDGTNNVRLAKGTAGKILTMNAGATAPEWATTNSIGLLAYPVGAIYISVVSTSPADLFGGTWSVFGAGKALVGYDSGDPSFYPVEASGGEKTHQLTTAELPSHTHSLNLRLVVTGGAFSAAHVASGNAADVSGSTGSGTAHNNLQPYIVVYMWKRTA